MFPHTSRSPQSGATGPGWSGGTRMRWRICPSTCSCLSTGGRGGLTRFLPGLTSSGRRRTSTSVVVDRWIRLVLIGCAPASGSWAWVRSGIAIGPLRHARGRPRRRDRTRAAVDPVLLIALMQPPMIGVMEPRRASPPTRRTHDERFAGIDAERIDPSDPENLLKAVYRVVLRQSHVVLARWNAYYTGTGTKAG